MTMPADYKTADLDREIAVVLDRRTAGVGGRDDLNDLLRRRERIEWCEGARAAMRSAS